MEQDVSDQRQQQKHGWLFMAIRLVAISVAWLGVWYWYWHPVGEHRGCLYFAVEVLPYFRVAVGVFGAGLTAIILTINRRNARPAGRAAAWALGGAVLGVVCLCPQGGLAKYTPVVTAAIGWFVGCVLVPECRNGKPPKRVGL